MSQQQRKIHDPLIDTIENSDDEKAEDIVAGSNDQLDIVAQDSSILGAFNGESICDSSGGSFKKGYNTGSSLADNPETMVALPLDPDVMVPFSIDLEGIHNASMPTRSKAVGRFSVSVSDSLPPHLMELDSPEPDLYEQEMQDNDALLMSTNTKELNVQSDSLQPSLAADDREMTILQAGDLPSPVASNGEQFDLTEETATVTLSTEAVTYSQSDIFASQPLTFGLEPKTIDLSPANLDSFDEDSQEGQPDILEIRTPSKESSPFSLLNELDFVSCKRKRDELEDHKSCKKLTLEQELSPKHQESDSSDDVMVLPDDDEIKLLSEADRSVEVISDNKLRDKESINSQDIRLFLSSNTQSVDSQRIESNLSSAPFSYVERSKNIYDGGRADSSSLLHDPYSNSNGSDVIEPLIRLQEAIDSQESNDSRTILTKAIVNLPRFDTPSEMTEEIGEVLFVNATNAARDNAPLTSFTDSLQQSNKSDSTPSFSSPAEIPMEKSVSSSTPSYHKERSKSKQSTSLTSQPVSKLFASQQTSTPEKSLVLAEDSDEDAKTAEKTSTPASAETTSCKSNDTEVEIIMEKNDVRSVVDLRKGKWNLSVTVRATINKWTHPQTKDVAYTIQGDDNVITCRDFEKIISTGSLSSGSSSRISNISSISGLTSDGYVADKSASASSGCTTASLPDATRFESTRRSMASVMSISPPKPLFKLPPVAIPCISTGTQTLHSPTHTKLKTPRSRGRPRGRPRVEKALTDPSIPETTKPDSPPVVHLSPEVIVETPEVEESVISETPFSSEADEIPAVAAAPPDKIDLDPMMDDFFCKLSPSLHEKLKRTQTTLSEDESKIFIDERKKHLEVSDDDQNTIVRQRVREVDIGPEMLVFARYTSDKYYYSGIIKQKDRDDRWKIVYNMDNQQASVREIYILPTDILPKSFPVYVLNPSRDFHEPGVVRGHVFREGILLHIVERINGSLATVPHSNMVLKEVHASILLKVRASYRSLLPSPGGDLALENVLLRRTRGISNSPRTPHRKADPNFDTSGQEDSSSRNVKSQSRADMLVTVEGSDSSSGSPYRKGARFNSPKTPRSPRSSAKSRKALKKSSLSSVSSQPESIPEVAQPLNPVVRLNPLSETEIPLQDTPKKRGRKPGMGKTPKKTRKLNEEEPNGFYKEYGPIPSENSTIFAGYSVLITEMLHTDKLVTFKSAPMDRDHLTLQIEAGGGKVLTSFSSANLVMLQEAKKASKPKEGNATKELKNLKLMDASLSPAKVLCVANAPCRTAKFIQCLTVGIPIVSTSWVITSCKYNECQNWILHSLPAGSSLLMGMMIEQPFEDCDDVIQANVSKVVDVLKGDKVFLATSSDPLFKSTWLDLLVTAQAQVFTKTGSGKLNRLMDRKTSVVLADATIPSDELQRAEEIKAPVVSTEWFIQCIIQRCKLQYTAHPKFQYNYVEKEKR